MSQKDIWEREYKELKLITGEAEPQKDVQRFLRFLRKSEGIELSGLKILDLGAGTGRNSNYLADLGNSVFSLEISETAVRTARERADQMSVSVDARVYDIGKPYPFEDNFFDLILDITSSNSLNEKEREVYLSEAHRVLRPGGYFFVRALCKDTDKNAKNLLKLNPGPEYDTYIMPKIGLMERVFSEKDFRDLYSPKFNIISLEKKEGYARFKGQNYKRIYWLAYVQKR